MKTYTCELEGCSNTRTIDNHRYDKAKTHYCSRECYGISRKGVKVKGTRPTDESNKITYVCDADGCDKTRTAYKSQLSAYSKRYCSVSCVPRTSTTKIINRDEVIAKYNELFSEYFEEHKCQYQPT